MESTIAGYRHHLHEFGQYLRKAGITSLGDLSPALLASCIVECAPGMPALKRFAAVFVNSPYLPNPGDRMALLSRGHFLSSSACPANFINILLTMYLAENIQRVRTAAIWLQRPE